MDTGNVRKTFLVMCILLVSLSSSLVSSADETKTRWYAQVALMEPRDATSAGAHIYIYDNYVSSNPDSFVAFSIAILRFDTVWQTLEWLEVGYFKDSSGFWVYSARQIFDGKGYIEAHWCQFNGQRASGESYLDFSIAQTELNTPNTFRAYMFDPMIGIWSQMEVNFTITGDNLWLAGSESSDPSNTLNCHFAFLWYGKSGNSYLWSDVKTTEDVPYHVYTVSSNEFFTYSGYGLGVGISPPTSGGTGGVAPRKK